MISSLSERRFFSSDRQTQTTLMGMIEEPYGLILDLG
jgi:hypothetical protein